jgi:signal transduction histidine kinase/CheY-like chemotaxis protein
MKIQSIRLRMLAAALVPVALVVVVIVSAFWYDRMGDIEADRQQRASLLVRQIAAAGEYGLFSVNRSNLQSLADSALTEPDVKAATFFDATGTRQAFAGKSELVVFNTKNLARYSQELRKQGVELFYEKVVTRSVALDDLYMDQAASAPRPTEILGYAVLEISRERAVARANEILALAWAVALAGLLVGGVLAMQLLKRVERPIQQLAGSIDRIAKGDFSTDTAVHAEDPLHELQTALNRMAQQLGWSRDQLEQRVADVTAELRLQKQEAERATRGKSRFLAAASHDLRQPTHALGMFVARLRQLPMDDTVRSLVDSLNASVHAMQDLLNGLLDLSRLEAGAVQVNVQPVSMGLIFEALQGALQPLADSKKLRLRIRPTKAWGLTDPLLLQRIVMNLAHNALRYTEKGTVLVSCRSAGNAQLLRIDVIDSGVGIAPEDQVAVFKEFYQVGDVGREHTMGLGLGLSIVERTAQLLGHRVVLQSEVGCGTRFSITLPATLPGQTPAMPAAPEALAWLNVGGQQILVIEDDAFAREAMESLLLSWGYGVKSASTQLEALDCVRSGFTPHVIVSDYQLVGSANGIACIAAVRAALGVDTPACLVSGDMDEGLVSDAKAAGLALLHKPVKPAKLRNLLRRYADL